MSLKTISNALTSKLGQKVLSANKHAPAILFGAGVVGVVATVILASRATLKLHEVIDDAQETLDKVANLEHATYSEKDRQRDTALIYFRTGGKIAGMYLPAFAVGAVSIALLTGSHVILTRRNVALTAAYAAIEKGFREYRARVIGELGEDKDREFRYGSTTKTIVEETETGSVTKDITVIGDGMPSIYSRWFDDSCSAWQKQPEYNRIFLKCQQNYLNDLLNARGWVTLNEAYECLGMKRSQAGMVVGWVKDDGDGYIDFGIFNGESHTTRDFVNGWADRVLLDFNVDGVIYDKVK